MSQPAFSDVQKPITDGAASAVAHPRREGVFSVFGSSNTLVSSAQLTQVSDITTFDIDLPAGVNFVEELKAKWSQVRGRVVLGERVKGRRTGPVQVLNKIANDWQLSHAELASLLAYPDHQSAADLLDGRASLRNPDREDRVRLLYRIYRILRSAFSEVDRQTWLRTANPNLHNKSPLEFMRERRIPGMISVQNLVERIVAR